MTSENFQKTVLEGLRDLKEGQSRLEDKLNDLEARNAARHLQMESKLNLLIEDKKSIFEILGEHEAEIRTLKRKLG